MKIATWNVNSLRARLELVTAWLARNEPSVLCMQETKVEDAAFPTLALQQLGYHVAYAGQKTYNGVAIASRSPLSDVQVGLLGAQQGDDKRVIAATVEDTRVVCVYAPNGKAVDSPAFEIKLHWFHALRELLEATPLPPGGVVVCGDFNIAPEERDVFDPELMRGQLHFTPAEHAALKRLCDFGLVDLFRVHNAEPKHYSWWDYRAGSFRRDQGLRIDYLLGSEQVAQRCRTVIHDKEERRRERPSDHCPVIAELS